MSSKSSAVCLLAAALLVVLYVDTTSAANAFRAPFHRFQHNSAKPATGASSFASSDPLFLTPYIKSGKASLARQLSAVDSTIMAGVESYSGFITVNETYGSSMFFWYFPNMAGNKDAPTLLWLQGGPGGSSMFGLLVEHGPISVDSNLKVVRRNVTWAQNYNMLYVDNPVGTGFSLTKTDAGFAKNEDDVARDLYSCLVQFFTVFAEVANNDFYVTGESYAGKYVPAISYHIHQENLKKGRNEYKIPLKGLATGDGFSDPETMVPCYPDLLYNFGLADELQLLQLRAMTSEVVYHIEKQDWVTAFDMWDAMLNGDTIKYPSFFVNITGCNAYFNMLQCEQPLYYPDLNAFFSQSSIRDAIHVGNLTFHDNDDVEMHLLSDMMQSVKPLFPTLLENYKVLVYSGQLDIIVGVPLTEAFLRSIPWSGLPDYKKAVRKIWRLQATDREVAGYVRQVGTFTQAVIRGAGHIAPADQPQRTLDMISNFVDGKPFTVDGA